MSETPQRRLAGEVGAGRDPDAREGSRIVLYRCHTPTNVLCPCGAVARKLRAIGLDHRTERVPYRRRGRPEIEELTRQKRVPVLVDGDEVIHDSKRIIEYLEWAYSPRPSEEPPTPDPE